MKNKTLKTSVSMVALAVVLLGALLLTFALTWKGWGTEPAPSGPDGTVSLEEFPRDIPGLDRVESFDMGGSLAGGGGTDSAMRVGRVYSTQSGTFYLRQRSFGDLLGQSMGDAPRYDRLLDGQYNMNYLLSYCQKNAGHQSVELRFEDMKAYMLPYGIAFGQENYHIPASDVENVSFTPEYELFCYQMMENYTDLAGMGGEYSEEELQYRAFVYKNYLTVDNQTREFLQKTIGQQNWNANDPDIVGQVASFIKSAASYNPGYDLAMDEAPNAVIAFLGTYQQGVCRHFAAAATMLYRALGIPARYTVGYVVQTQEKAYTDITTPGHAWVEVYLNGVGWVPVEVTPGFELGGHGQTEEGVYRLGGGPGSDFKKSTVGLLTSDTAGTFYLKQTSYGDLYGNTFYKGQAFSHLLSGGYDYTYLLSRQLEKAGLPTTNLNFAQMKQSMLPYFGVLQRGKTPLTDSDVQCDFDAESYEMLCYQMPANTKLLRETAIEQGSLSRQEQAYSQFVHENYLQVEDETRQYLQQLIEEEGFDLSDPWLVERVALYIQKAARYNLKYDSALDQEQNTVVAFLRDYKEGICQHYAAAATMLYRTLGIPARFTVGFVVTAQAGVETPIVTPGHAWVEVYIEGAGWIPVEVTGSDNSGNQIPPSITELTLRPALTEKPYDGSTLYAQDKVSGFPAELRASGYRCTVKVSGQQTQPGKSASRIESLVIWDEAGKDVTDQFLITLKEGVVHVYRQEFTFVSDSAYETYSGTPIFGWDGGCRLTGSLPSGFSFRAVPRGEQTEVGISPNYYDITIFDPSGNDVTDEYKVTLNCGTLEVLPVEITVRTLDGTKDYDGKPLRVLKYVVEGQLIPGHSLYLAVTGQQLEPGTSDNTVDMDSILIVDGSGQDVTKNYQINLELGTLRVNP